MDLYLFLCLFLWVWPQKNEFKTELKLISCRITYAVTPALTESILLQTVSFRFTSNHRPGLSPFNIYLILLSPSWPLSPHLNLSLQCVFSATSSLSLSNSLSCIRSPSKLSVFTHTHTTFDFTLTLPYAVHINSKITMWVCLSIITHPSIHPSICSSIHPSIFHPCGELNICLYIHLSSLLNLHVSLSFSIFTIQSPTHPSVQPPFKGSPACTQTHTQRIHTPTFMHRYLH